MNLLMKLTLGKGHRSVIIRIECCKKGRRLLGILKVPTKPVRTIKPHEAEDNLFQTFDTRKVQEAQKQGGVNSPVLLERSRVVFEKVGPNSRVVLQRDVNSPLVLEQQGLNSPSPYMIKVPENLKTCPPGEQLGKDGVCREVLD